jgi:hypothetical protein
MMKKYICILFLGSSLFILGQDEPRVITPLDSLEKGINKNIILPVSVKPEIFIPLSAVNSFSLSLKFGINPYSPVADNIAELNNDLYFSQSLLKEQFKSSFIYSMLGAVQTGAVGYMAYKHLKKYGLFR